jgi:hypothetical protein
LSIIPACIPQKKGVAPAKPVAGKYLKARDASATKSKKGES